MVSLSVTHLHSESAASFEIGRDLLAVNLQEI